MYIVQASTYSKVYMRDYQEFIEDDPDFALSPWDHPLAGKETNDGQKIPKRPFHVIIPRSLGALHLTHNKPLHIQKLLPPQDGRRMADDRSPKELENAVNWLAGSKEGRSAEESDIYGVVRLSVDLDVSSVLVDIADASEEKQDQAAKDYKDLQKDLISNINNSMKSAKEEADKKVLEQMKATHRNLMQAFERMKADGQGRYTPSAAEVVGAHILHDELQKTSERRRAMLEKMDDLIKTTQF
jgi:hypothetical protein